MQLEVSVHLSVTRVPPHLVLTPSAVAVRLTNTAQGNSCASASVPPRIVVWVESKLIRRTEKFKYLHQHNHFFVHSNSPAPPPQC